MKYVLALVALAVATPTLAADLPLPTAASGLLARLAADCAECATAGYTPCGSEDVGWGRRFATAALLGTPKRGYLATFTMTGQEFRVLARTTAYATLLTTLHDRFAKTRLVVIEEAFTNARVLPHPTNVTVSFPEPLHTCVHDTERPWGCCTGNCKHECCEKALGSPKITMEWADGDEQLTFHYTHAIGTTWLSRKVGDRHFRYACLVDAKGELR